MSNELSAYKQSEEDHAMRSLTWLVDRGYLMDLGRLGDGWREYRLPPKLADLIKEPQQ